MSHSKVVVGTRRSRDLLDGVASTLRRLEREASGMIGPDDPTEGASRRLDTFQRSLARALQQAHLETVQELAGA